MGEFHRIGRRAFLTELGRGAVAITVFTPIIGACSSNDGGDFSGPTASEGSTTAAPVVGTNAPPPATVAPGTTGATAATGPADEGREAVTYRRINLGFVSAYVLIRGSEAAVVDTGVAGSAGAIAEGLRAASLDWDAVGHVILTHHHPDHAGSIGDVLDSAVNATAYAGEADIASITAPRPLASVLDGDEVFGLQIVGTPGHTAGHISIYDPLGQVLVAGDAINNAESLTGPNPQFTADMATAIESARRLAGLALETIYFGHGAPIEHGAGPRLVELAASL